MTRIFASLSTASILLLLGGCETTYEPYDVWSGTGFRDASADRNVFVTFFRGVGGTTDDRKERVADFTLLRMAELCLKNGYPYFVLLEGYGQGLDEREVTEKNEPVAEDYNIMRARVDNASALALGYREIPEAGNTYFDARKVVDTLNQKYQLAVPNKLMPYSGAPETVEFEVDPLYRDLPKTAPEAVVVRPGFRNKDFDGIQIGVYMDTENPFEGFSAPPPVLEAAANIGAQALVVEDDYASVQQYFTDNRFIGYAIIAYLLPEANLGIQWEPGDQAIGKYVIRRFYPNSRAAASDLKIGDKVLEINGVDLLDTAAFNAEWITWSPGDQIQITYVRDGEEKTVTVEAVSNSLN